MNDETYENQDPMEGQDQEIYYLNTHTSEIKCSEEWLDDLGPDELVELIDSGDFIEVQKVGDEWLSTLN